MKPADVKKDIGNREIRLGVGWCKKKTKKNKKVSNTRKYWKKNSEKDKVILIFYGYTFQRLCITENKENNFQRIFDNFRLV
jgi:hypothetical protein